MLFNPSEITNAGQLLVDWGISPKKNFNAVKNVNNDLAEIQEAIQNNDIVNFYTDGSFSLYNLVGSLLKITGKSDLYFSTWSITEEPIRAIFQLKELGYLNEIHAIVDHRIKINSPNGFQLANSFFDTLELVKVHAKTTIISNSEWNITIIGSANWTKNPRLEVGVILKCEHTANFYKGIINEKIIVRRRNENSSGFCRNGTSET